MKMREESHLIFDGTEAMRFVAGDLEDAIVARERKKSVNGISRGFQ